MSRRVVDTSVVLAWCFEDEANDYSNAILDGLDDDEAVVPSIWPLEVANGLANAERHGRIDLATSTRFLKRLSDLPIRVDQQTATYAFTHTLVLARNHQLTSHDASYLELALREGLELATLDHKLRTAAQRAGARVFEL